VSEKKDPSDKLGVSLLGGTMRALRGGSWKSSPNGVRVSQRDRYDPAVSFFDVGLRCAGEVVF